MKEDVKSQLERYSPAEALAILHAQERKLRENSFVRFWTPIPKQQEVFQKFSKDIKLLGLLGGNRSGKTELGAFIAMAWLLGKKFFEGSPAYEFVKYLPIPEGRPRNIWAVGMDFPTLSDVIWQEKLEIGRNHPGFIPREDPIIKRHSATDLRIVAADGSTLVGKSAEAGREKFQSASVDLIWIDEEPNVDIYDECYQRTADCEGKILLTLTPLTDASSGVREPWVFELYEDWQKGQKDLCFIQLSVLDNPHVPETEKQKLLQKWSGHVEERARLYGDFIQRSGLVYREWDIKKHVVDRFEIPKSWGSIISIDPAATGPTGAVHARISPDDDIYIVGDYCEKDLTISDHVKNLLLQFPGPVDIWLIDPFWGRQRTADTHKTGAQLYRDAGIPVRFPAGVTSEEYGVNKMREYIAATVTPGTRHPKLYVFRDCMKFQEEIKRYTWGQFGKGENKGLSKEKPTKRNADIMNAAQFLCAIHPKGRHHAGPRQVSDEERREQARLNSYS